ncbi:hypothetical protein GRAN_1107 [Granulicella sibirica]|uniref:Uncharacterized protein n=1 Tax=Granulicella sibirica TaxID=2479048 RepID=A0A4Q0T3F3_9BACT|nr:hypothetical protein GRAN_1107 [Granulicella sibirica]
MSFVKVDDHTWHMDRVDSRTMSRVYTVSPDDQKLTLVDEFKDANEITERNITQYHRTSPGKSIYGQWKSFSMEIEVLKPESIVIQPFEKNGLSITELPEEVRTDMYFDGKEYRSQGPGGPLARSRSARRTNPYTIEMEYQDKGELSGTQECTVSKDGKTLTTTGKPVTSPVSFTSVWDKK